MQRLGVLLFRINFNDQYSALLSFPFSLRQKLSNNTNTKPYVSVAHSVRFDRVARMTAPTITPLNLVHFVTATAYSML